MGLDTVLNSMAKMEGGGCADTREQQHEWP